MSSSTGTISSNSTKMNNNDRKRPISSSIHSSPSPPLRKRCGLSSNSRHLSEKIIHQHERHKAIAEKSTEQYARQSRTKERYENLQTKNSYMSAIEAKNSNESLFVKKSNLTSSTNNNRKFDSQTNAICAKKSKSISLTVQTQNDIVPNYDDNSLDRKKTVTNTALNKTACVVMPSTIMTIVKNPDSSKNSIRTDNNVIIQPIDTNMNVNGPKPLMKLLVPKSTTSSIKMLSSGDGLASALRIPTKIHLTKTSFESSIINGKKSTVISTTNSVRLLNQEQSITSSSMNIPLEVSDILQQPIADYHSSTTLPPTPPPPIVENKTSNNRHTLSHKINNQQNDQIQIQENSLNNVKDSSLIREVKNDQILDKHNSSSLSDWSVPPTSELSPTSLTSSSPELTQHILQSDENYLDIDTTKSIEQTTKRFYRSTSSLTKASIQGEKQKVKSQKFKSVARLVHSTDARCTLVKNKNLSSKSSSNVKKRQRVVKENVNSHRSCMNSIQLENDDHSTIRDTLNEIIERICEVRSHKKPKLKVLRNNSKRKLKNINSSHINDNKEQKREVSWPIASIDSKNYSSSQTYETTERNETRSLILTQAQLDECAYLLHVNTLQANCDRSRNSTIDETEARDLWLKLSIPKKKSYYKRVIELYKRPNRNVIISSSTFEKDSSAASESYNETKTLPIVEMQRQTSTPLSFHSLACSSVDDQSMISPEEIKNISHILKCIVTQLINSINNWDKLSCKSDEFMTSINHFVQLSQDEKDEKVKCLVEQIQKYKKDPRQFQRATIYCEGKIKYFALKHAINSSNESMNELTLIVKYFYFCVLLLHYEKQKVDFEMTLNNLLNGSVSFDHSFSSAVLTSIIADLILKSSFANDYLACQPITIGDSENILPFVHNVELENDLLNKSDSSQLSFEQVFSDIKYFEEYLKSCEDSTTDIPSYPTQGASSDSSMYYSTYAPHSHQYYYSSHPQTPDMSYYYYNPSVAYSNSTSMYPYTHPTYYHPQASYNNNNERYNYYCNQQQQSSYAYSSSTNNMTDIPVSNNPSQYRVYQQMNSNIQRTYSNSQQSKASTASTLCDTLHTVSSQSNSIRKTINNYSS